MFRLFVSRTSPRRPRSATPEVETLEKILTLSSVSVEAANLGNALKQQIDQQQQQDVKVDFQADTQAQADGNESNAQNNVTNDVQVETGYQSQTASNTADQQSYTSLNGGIGN